MGKVTALILATYLAASINFAILLFKVLGKGDPRERYSSNAGTVNVTRQLGHFWGLVILILDMGRAGATAYWGKELLPGPFVPLLGLVLVIGNQNPLFHRFRGGKGVASFLGFTAFLSPGTAGASCLAWVLTYGLARQPFIGSIVMITVLGVGTVVRYDWAWPAILGSGLTMALILRAHKSNIVAYGKNREKTKGKVP
jgi:glycerol-3-phosphate acyltransferase PlsY